MDEELVEMADDPVDESLPPSAEEQEREMDHPLARSIGRLEGQVEALIHAVQEQTRAVNRRLQSHSEKLDDLQAFRSRTKGAGALLVVLSAGGLFVAFRDWVQLIPPPP